MDGEGVVRRKLEKLVWAHRYHPDGALALAVWFRKDDPAMVHLFEVLAIPSSDIPEMARPLRMRHEMGKSTWSLATPLDHVFFSGSRNALEQAISGGLLEREWYQPSQNSEVLMMRSDLLSDTAIQHMGISTRPDNMVRGWYLSQHELKQAVAGGDVIGRSASVRPHVGVLQVSPLQEFNLKAGIMHVEVGGRWLPSTQSGVQSYTWFMDAKAGHAGAFLFEGGDLFRIDGFEVRSSREYSRLVLVPNEADEYVEVHLARVPIPVAKG